MRPDGYASRETLSSIFDWRTAITSQLDKPFNVLASTLPGASVEQFAQAGAKRISVGGALNYAAINPLLTAGKEMLEAGTFDWLGNLAKGQEVRKLLA